MTDLIFALKWFLHKEGWRVAGRAVTAWLLAGHSRSLGRGAAPFFSRRRGRARALLLAPPLLWMGVVYLGSLAALLIQSFFHLDDFTGQVVRQFTLATYRDLFTRVNLDIAARTAFVAAIVTLAAALLAFPLAYYMARFASPRM